MGMQWQPPSQPPPAARKSWLPAAIIGAAIVIAGALMAGAVILKGGGAVTDGGATTTCEAWAETRQTLRAIPALPGGWNWNTPNIENYIRIQNAPVGAALDLFEPKIAAEPVDVARAAEQYIAARRAQMAALTDRSYVPADGNSVDSALARLNQLCGIVDDGRSI
ncbi:MAG: hypothetical protein WBB54_14705 [Mycobacterium sp.]